MLNFDDVGKLENHITIEARERTHFQHNNTRQAQAFSFCGIVCHAILAYQY